MSLAPLLLFVGIVLIGMFYFQNRSRQARTGAVVALAEQIGFTYSPDDAYGITGMPFSLFQLGDGRKAQLVISGTHNNLPLQIFDYEYYIEGRSRQYHHFTCAVLTIPAACPWLRVTRENALTRLEEHLGHHDVQLEYDDFNREFVVNCADQKFAFSLLDAQMMQWLLGIDRFDRVEVVGPWVLLSNAPVEPKYWRNLGTWLDAFHTHIPAIVYSTYPRR